MEENDELGELNRKDGMVHFSNRKHPWEAVCSVSMAGISLIAGIVVVILSAQLKGKAGDWIGLVGALSLLTAITGLIMALFCIRKEDVRYRFINIGALTNGLLTILYFIILISGAVA